MTVDFDVVVVVGHVGGDGGGGGGVLRGFDWGLRRCKGGLKNFGASPYRSRTTSQYLDVAA